MAFWKPGLPCPDDCSLIPIEQLSENKLDPVRDYNIDGLAKDIEENGLQKPLRAYSCCLIIRDGYRRLQAIRSLRWKFVPVKWKA